MDRTTLTTLLNKAKTTLRVTTQAFDEEITDIVRAGIEEMTTRGVCADERINDPLVIRALMTYVRVHFGDPDDPDRLRRSYETQLGQLMTTTNYTDWGDRRG